MTEKTLFQAEQKFRTLDQEIAQLEFDLQIARNSIVEQTKTIDRQKLALENKKHQNAIDFVAFMNTLIATDGELIGTLLYERLGPCSPTLRDHPSVQVSVRENDGAGFVSLMGIINGYFGVLQYGPRKGWGHILFDFDEDGVLRGTRFQNEQNIAHDLAYYLRELVELGVLSYRAEDQSIDLVEPFPDVELTPVQQKDYARLSALILADRESAAAAAAAVNNAESSNSSQDDD
jgi:hypothetical protein